jgi:hypothetical protein
MEIQSKQQEYPQQAQKCKDVLVGAPSGSQRKATTTPSVPTETESGYMSMEVIPTKQQEEHDNQLLCSLWCWMN